jgi:adenine-specific DNA-methyltransferase
VEAGRLAHNLHFGVVDDYHVSKKHPVLELGFLPRPSFETEGVRYTGSKRALIPRIHDLIHTLPIRSALDAFAGTTRVSQYFKSAGYDVHANDVAPYSVVFGRCYIENCDVEMSELDEKLDHLNKLNPRDGYFTEHFGGEDDGVGNVKSGDGKKKPFLKKNTRKLDAIRDEIDRIADDKIEHAIFVTALIHALDSVENTLGHQVAYLSKWAPRAHADLVLRRPRLISGNGDYRVTRMDARAISGRYDLAYFDPPYNTNNPHTPTTRVRYASYYHLWTTIVLNDKPEAVGAANRRLDCSSDSLPTAISRYESTKYNEVFAEIEQLVASVDARYVLFSYSNKGKITIKDLREIFSHYKVLAEKKISHRENVQRRLTSNREWLGDQSDNFEHLFLVEKE